MTAVAIMVAVLTMKAGDMVPYIAMPANIGYAVSASGQRLPTALAMRDAVYAPRPQYPYNGALVPGQVEIEHPLTGNGLYHLEFNLTTGRVNHVTVVSWSGFLTIKDRAIAAFQHWAVRPGTWKEITIGVAVRKKWLAVG